MLDDGCKIILPLPTIYDVYVDPVIYKLWSTVTSPSNEPDTAYMLADVEILPVTSTPFPTTKFPETCTSSVKPIVNVFPEIKVLTS